MLRGVLFDFNGTLARLSSCGVSHRVVFARHDLRQAATRWGDGWLVDWEILRPALRMTGGQGRRRGRPPFSVILRNLNTQGVILVRE